jgi:hypothetical protein
MLIALDEHGFSHTIMLTQSREHGTHSQTDPLPNKRSPFSPGGERLE